MSIKVSNIISLLLSLLINSNVWAVSAYPYQVLVKTQDGKEVAITLQGDENLKYAITADGYTLLSDNDGWWYATMENGKTVKSPFKLMAVEDEPQELKQFKVACQKGIVPERNSYTQTNINKTLGHRAARHTTPVVGKRKALVIMMQFRDLAFKNTNEDFSALFNDIDYHENNVTGSVRDFYRFASQGQLDYVSDVYGPYTAINNMSYYGSNTVIGGNDAHAVELCIEAMMNLPDTIDFSVYDNDGDGLIDNVHIIFAGYGEEAGGPSNAIWSHEYPYNLILTNEIKLAGYSCSPEFRGNNGSNISYIGVICHELGHSLGAMDYYDTNYGTGGEYDGTGKWDIMGSGSWNDEGRTPPNFNPYVRSTVFGWNAQEILRPGQEIVMPRMEINNAEQSKVYKLETESANDYFLLENRQQYGFDAALPGAGLMIYHVHPDIDKHHSTNTVNATHPQGLYPVCASYSEPDKGKYGNINSSECPFPWNNAKFFSAYTSPAAIAWNGSLAKVSLQDIIINSNDEVTFTTSGEDFVNPDTLSESSYIIYKESFETGLTDAITVNAIQGNNKWQSYKRGDLVIGADNIPSPTDGERILMLFSGKSNTVSEAEAISPYIEIERGENYIFAFDVNLTAESNQTIPQFDLYIEDEYGENCIYSLIKETEGWEKVELPLLFAGNGFRYKLCGKIVSGGIFIDNIQLFTSNISLGHDSIKQSIDRDFAKVYRPDGFYIGDYDSIHTSLKKGLYIIRKSNYVRKIFVSD